MGKTLLLAPVGRIKREEKNDVSWSNPDGIGNGRTEAGSSKLSWDEDSRTSVMIHS